MGHQVTIGEETFRSKAEAKRKIADLANKYMNTCDLQGDDLAFALSLLSMHPSADEKIGCGVYRIFVSDSGRGNWSYFIQRNDGTVTDFSAYKCIDRPSNRANAMAAFRDAVSADVAQFKREFFARDDHRCTLTGKSLTWDEAHVDHVFPETFSALVERFASCIDLDLDDVETVSVDGQAGRKIAQDWLADGFVSFHRVNAVLRVISAEANMKLSNKGGVL